MLDLTPGGCNTETMTKKNYRLNRYEGERCDNCGGAAKANNSWLYEVEKPSFDSPGETLLLCSECFDGRDEEDYGDDY